jgi:hypothetical protein
MNYKRGYPRTTHHSRGRDKHRRHQPDFNRYYWLSQWPRSWDIVFHTRPRRRRTRVAEIRVMKGYDPDDVLWPLEKKPHIYYW